MTHLGCVVDKVDSRFILTTMDMNNYFVKWNWLNGTLPRLQQSVDQLENMTQSIV